MSITKYQRNYPPFLLNHCTNVDLKHMLVVFYLHFICMYY